MKFKSILFAALAAAASFTASAAGIYGSYVQVEGNWYELQQPDASGLPLYQGSSFGPYQEGSSAYLTGAEGLTWKNDGQDVTGVTFYWAVRAQGSADALAWSSSPVGWTANTSFNDASGYTYATGNNQKWAELGGSPVQPIDFLAGLNVSTDTVFDLFVYLSASTTNGMTYVPVGDGSFYDAANPHAASFTLLADVPATVPEPASLALMALGLAGVAAARRRPSR